LDKCPFSGLAKKIGSSTPKSEWLEKATSEHVNIDLDSNSYTARQMIMINLQEDVKLLKAIQPLITQHIDEITSS